MSQVPPIYALLDQADYIKPHDLFVIAPLPHWARMARIKPGAKIVLSRVLQYSNYHSTECCSLGECNASVQTIASETGLDGRTVQRNLRLLVSAGLLRASTRSHRTTIYVARVTKGGNLNRHLCLWLPRWLLRLESLRPAHKLVYAAIAQSVTDNGWAFVSYTRITERTGVARTTAIEAVRHLLDIGMLARRRIEDGKFAYAVRAVDEMKGEGYFKKEVSGVLEESPEGKKFLLAATKEETQ